MATIIRPNGTEESVEPANGSNFSLEELQKIIGGYIEVLPCKEKGKIIVANDESKILGLEHNQKATELADIPSPDERNRAIAEMRKQGVTVINTMGESEEDYIAGTVLVCENSEVQ